MPATWKAGKEDEFGYPSNELLLFQLQNPQNEFLQRSSKLRPYARDSMSELPKLPIPTLAETAARYLTTLRPLQTDAEHKTTADTLQRWVEKDGKFDFSQFYNQ